MIRYCIFFVSVLFSPMLLAWNSVGHRLVAQIAYDQLKPAAKAHVDQLTAVMFHSPYPENRFMRAATWPDYIRDQAPQYTPWHYIDIPIAHQDNNVVWAISRAEKIVADPSENLQRRAKYLSFLIHFVGDIHQPLHCATLVNAQFLLGDQGGNQYPIHADIATNLHAFWDDGLGLFVSPRHDYQFHYWQIESLARQWMKNYPPAFFGARLAPASPMTWAIENNHIAMTFAYQIPMNSTPTAAYIQQGQTLVQQQIVLAGDRLANILNQIFYH